MENLFNDPAFWMMVVFIGTLAIKVPIAVALGFAALAIVWVWDMGIGMLSLNFFAGIAKFPLLAIPFFILAGYIMEKAGIAARIINLMEALVGERTGGLAMAAVAATQTRSTHIYAKTRKSSRARPTAYCIPRTADLPRAASERYCRSSLRTTWNTPSGACIRTGGSRTSRSS